MKIKEQSQEEIWTLCKFMISDHFHIVSKNSLDFLITLCIHSYNAFYSTKEKFRNGKIFLK